MRFGRRHFLWTRKRWRSFARHCTSWNISTSKVTCTTCYRPSGSSPGSRRNGLFYALSPTGADALSLFEDNLLRSLRAAIDGYLTEHAQELRLRTCTHAESIRLSEHHYRVTLQIMEDDLAIFELTFFADSAQEADKYPRRVEDARPLRLCIGV